MNSSRTKYLESGTGQVGYLAKTESGSWVFELFCGGPKPYQHVQELESREEMDEWLEAAGFRREGP